MTEKIVHEPTPAEVVPAHNGFSDKMRLAILRQRTMAMQGTSTQMGRNLHSFNPCHDERWSRFLSLRQHASVFHTAGWLEALQRTYGYEPVVYTTSPSGTELSDGMLFCRIKTWLSGPRLVSVPFSDHAAILTDEADTLHQIFSLVQDQVKNKICKYIEIRPTTRPTPAPEGFAQSSKFYWHRLALDKDLDPLYRSFHRDCIQRKIKRAEREKLTYAEGRSEELLHQFYRLFLVTHSRHGTPPQPMSWFRNLIRCLGENLQIRVASKNGVPVASIITLTYKQSMVYKYGCSDAKYHNLGGMMFLFWQAIQEAKVAGLQEFDLGRSDCDNAGLIGFKEHWKAERSTLEYWRYPSESRPYSNQWNVKLARRVLSRLPVATLPVVGQLLYRHMG